MLLKFTAWATGKLGNSCAVKRRVLVLPLSSTRVSDALIPAGPPILKMWENFSLNYWRRRRILGSSDRCRRAHAGRACLWRLPSILLMKMNPKPRTNPTSATIVFWGGWINSREIHERVVKPVRVHQTNNLTFLLPRSWHNSRYTGTTVGANRAALNMQYSAGIAVDLV